MVLLGKGDWSQEEMFPMLQRAELVAIVQAGRQGWALERMRAGDESALQLAGGALLETRPPGSGDTWSNEVYTDFSHLGGWPRPLDPSLHEKFLVLCTLAV